MANGYQRGDYLTQFLQQLPQIYRAQQNLDLQREKFEYAKEEGVKDNQYRQEVLSANEERNKLVREQFEQGKLENKQDETYRDATLKNTEKTQAYNAYNQMFGVVKETGDKDVLHLLAKQHPFAKENPEIIDALNEGYDISESMGQTVRSLKGMSPIDALKTGRTLYTSQYLDDDLTKQLDSTLKEKEEDLKFTMKDLENTPFGVEYAMYYERFINKDKYLPHGASSKERMEYDRGLLNKMDEIYQTAKQEEILSGGTWNEPFYDNVEDMGNDELDTLIADFSAPFTERYPFSPDMTDTLDFPIREPEVKVAGFKTSPLVKPGGEWKGDSAVLEDEAGKNKLIEEYSKTGEATYGPLEAIASEGSVVMPTSKKTFEAVDAGVNILKDAYNTMSKITSPGYVFDTFGKAGEKAGSPAKWDKEYKESSKKLKKIVQDMYNLYLRLDPSKGEFKKRPQAYKKLRNRLAFQLARLKNLASENPETWGDGTVIDPRQMPKWSKSPLGGDPEILSILRQIEL